MIRPRIPGKPATFLKYTLYADSTRSDSSGFDAGLNEEDDVFAESGADDEIFAEDGAFAQDRVFARDALSAEEVKTTVAIVEQDDDHVEEETQAETQMVYHAPTVEDLPEVDAQGIWPPTACIFVAKYVHSTYHLFCTDADALSTV